MITILVGTDNKILAYSTDSSIGSADPKIKKITLDYIEDSIDLDIRDKYCYSEEKGFYENPNIDKLTHIKEQKIQELSNTCSQTIYAGIPITLSNGETQHFTLTEQDQLNLSGLGLKLTMGATQVAWHEDNEDTECQYYSAQDAQLIIGTLTTFKEYHITYFRDLRKYVRSLDTIEKVNDIYYGSVLPEEYKSQVLKDLEIIVIGGA